MLGALGIHTMSWSYSLNVSCIVVDMCEQMSPKVLVIERGRKGGYQIPKGHIRPGEHLRDGAVRELREETGLSSPIICGDLIGTDSYSVFRTGHHNKIAYYFFTIPE